MTGVSLLIPESSSPQPTDQSPLVWVDGDVATCSDPKCTRRATHKGMCFKHYLRMRRALNDPTAAVSRRPGRTKEARDAMAAEAFEYARLHLAGARIAARKGDTRPAEWALLHTRTVEPVNKDGDGGGPRIVVQVGVALPGLGNAVSELPTASVATSLPARTSDHTTIDTEQ